MGALWENPARRKEMGREGRRKMEVKFTPESHYEQTMAVYRSVIK
jgi:hypothetical protein